MAMARATRMLAALLLVGGCADVLGIGEFVDEVPAEGREAADGDGGGGGAEGVPGPDGGQGGVSPRGWVSAFGAEGMDVASGVGVDASDAVVVAGLIEGQVSFGGGAVGAAGERSLFVARFGSDGGHLGSTAGRGPAAIDLLQVALGASGKVALAGSYRNGWLGFAEQQAPAAGADADVFVVALDSTLAPSFVVGYTAAGDQKAHAVAIDPSAGAVVIGGSVSLSFAGGASSGADDEDAFVLALDPQGEIAWARDWGDGQDQRVSAVALDEAGNTLIAGSFSGTMDLGGGPLTAAAHDLFVAKLDAAGNHVFSRRFGLTAVHEVAAIEAVGDGVVVAGSFVGATEIGGHILESTGGALASDVFVARLDPSGEVVWARRLGGTGPDRLHGLASGASGALLVSGAFSGAFPYGTEPGEALDSQGGDDAFVLSLDAAGQPAWAVGFGRNDDDYASGVALDSAGEVVTAGTFQVGFLLDGEKVSGIGAGDVFVAKLLR